MGASTEIGYVTSRKDFLIQEISLEIINNLPGTRNQRAA